VTIPWGADSAKKKVTYFIVPGEVYFHWSMSMSAVGMKIDNHEQVIALGTS